MKSAWLDDAHLQGASLKYARLQGASLQHADLQGTSLVSAHLQGALLNEAQLQGASLVSAHLQGTALNEATLEGALLNEAQLQGAVLRSADLRGAELVGAQLNGALLEFTQLQGASLEGANLAGAVLDNPFVWRARFSLESLDDLAPSGMVWDSTYISSDISSEDHKLEPWTEDSYKALKKIIGDRVLIRFLDEEEEYKVWSDAVLKRIEILDPNRPFEFEAEVPKWKVATELLFPAEPRSLAELRSLVDRIKRLVPAHLPTSY